MCFPDFTGKMTSIDTNINILYHFMLEVLYFNLFLREKVHFLYKSHLIYILKLC